MKNASKVLLKNQWKTDSAFQVTPTSAISCYRVLVCSLPREAPAVSTRGLLLNDLVCSFFCSFTACPTAGKHCFPRITPLEETLFLFNIGSVSSFILPTSGLHPCYIHLKSFFQSLGAIFLHFPKDTSPPKILFQQAHESVYI